MIKFYTNRELSEKLSIGLSKWKRWSREFLPPDPLGGLQSGYARQYTQDPEFLDRFQAAADAGFDAVDQRTQEKRTTVHVRIFRSIYLDNSHHRRKK